MFELHKKYFLLTLLLFFVEVIIAVFVHDSIIRPYVGDLLVVILLYCAVKSIIHAPVQVTAYGVLLFSYLVEALQYFNIVHHLGLADSQIANIIIGNYFSWIDILAYTLGTVLVISIENGLQHRRNKAYKYDLRV